jgi:hypothetical protein
MQTVCPQCNFTITHEAKNKNSRPTSTATCKRCGHSATFGTEGTAAMDAKLKAAARQIPESAMPPVQLSAHPAVSSQRAIYAILEAYPDLRNLDLAKFDLEAIFIPTKKGTYKTGKNKFKARILKSVLEKANKILTADEKIFRIAKGTAYYPAELLIGNGYLTMLYNQYAILCTNKRLLFINIDSRVTRATHYVFQIVYEEIKSIKKGLLLGHLIINRRRGKRRVYNAVKRYLLNDIKEFVEKAVAGIDEKATPQPPLEKLCPACFIPLEENLTQCPKCSAQFKKPKTAFLKSLMLPGWGDIYLGHRLLGVFELMGSALVWLIVISLLLSGAGEDLVVAAAVFLFYNLLDGLLTYHMAGKGYMLA